MPRAPRVPLVAIYPNEGTLFSDSPFIMLERAVGDAAEQATAARLFEDFVQRPENQKKVLEYGFRPNNPTVPVDDPISAENGVDPTQPQAELEVPAPDVLVKFLDAWAEQRKEARVLLVLDISGSMGDPATDDATKLDLAKQAAISALDSSRTPTTSGCGCSRPTSSGPTDPNYRELVPVGTDRRRRDAISADQIDAQFPTNGTPLYDVDCRSRTTRWSPTTTRARSTPSCS